MKKEKKIHVQKISDFYFKYFQMYFKIILKNIFLSMRMQSFQKEKKKEETFESFVYKYITWILIYDSNL